MKVVVAMSGGVDSSVAAVLLKEAGYHVIGVTMQIWPRGRQGHEAEGYEGCCGIDAAEDAKRVAYKLGIPHYVMNFRDIFSQIVIADFCEEYTLGRTPNPCIKCNQYIKFGILLEKAMQLGADFIATGHYARVETDESTGRYLLKKGIDGSKDQSYFLYPLTQDQLSHALFPIGSYSKTRVKEIARERELSVASRPESQEICFIPDNDYSQFVRTYIPQAARPGPILNKQGAILGEHRGIFSYTIGQRKGLGIAAPNPLYVIAIEPERNAVVVGGKEDVYRSELIASNLNWISIAALEQPTHVKAKIRYRHEEAAAEVIPGDGGRVRVIFNKPQMAITPGQAVVFYDGDTVTGGGTIERAITGDKGGEMKFA